MAHSHHSCQGNEDMHSSTKQHLNEIGRKSKIVEGFLTRYVLDTSTIIDGERLKRVAFGEKDKSKPHRTILLVGETGSGKSTLINAMVTYMLGISSEDRIWCEISETKRKQTKSQTIAVTVYDVFTEHSPFSLTVIDTPGFGSTDGMQEDLKVTESLYELFRSAGGVHEIDAVCLVVPSHTVRITERLLYIFNSVLSLFGKDVEKNIVIFFTYAANKPTNAINAIKESKIPYAQTDKGEPVYFRINNFHCEDFNDEEILDDYQTSWNLLKKNMESFVTFLEGSETISLKKTEEVLRNRKQLTASIFNIKDRITLAELKQKELEDAQKALQEHVEKNGSDKCEYEVEEAYKEKVQLKYSLWNMFTKEATCCKDCEENCHYPGCWWVHDLSKCSVMSEGKCTVCTNKCPSSAHIKEDKIYEIKTRTVKKTNTELKMKYDTVSQLEKDIETMRNKKISLVNECYQCVVKLEEIALKSDSVYTLQHLDFLIEKVKETGTTEQVQKLEELKNRADKQLTQISKYFSAMQFYRKH